MSRGKKKGIAGWRRVMIQGGLLVLCILVCTGCSAKKAGPDAEAKAENREELLLWSYYETDAQIRGLDELVADFNNSQDRYRMSWGYVTMSAFDRRISRAYTEKALPDLVLIDNPAMLRFIQLGLFEDITEYAKNLNLETDYYPASTGTVRRNGHYFGVPFNSNNVCLFYNREIMENAGIEIPEDWDSFKEAAGKAVAAGYDGFLMSCIDSEQGAFQILSWIMAASMRLDRKGISEAFAFLQELVTSGALSAECLNYSQTDIARKFAEGKIAMMENGPWVFSILDEAGIDYGMAPLPKGNHSAVILGGENLGIMRGKNVEGSVEFIRYCMEDGGIEKFCETAQMLPSRIETAEKSLEKNPKLEVTARQMEYAVARTDIEGWNSYSGRITEYFAQVLEGTLTPEEAANRILL